MNLLLLTEGDRVSEDRFAVRDQRLRHIQDVLHTQPGQQLRVGLLGGDTGTGQLLELDKHQALFAVSLDSPPPPKLPLELVLALPRPKMLRRILRTVAECGVPRLHLINSYRVEKSYWQTPVLAPAATRGFLLQGLEQARDTVLPEVNCHRRFKPFAEDVLPSLTAGKRALVAHPGDHPPCPRQVNVPTLVAIGPEGGFIPYEVDKLREAGCEPVSLGPRILRVETALTSLLGRLG
jgi:RsmE family RNA methyltransferase